MQLFFEWNQAILINSRQLFTQHIHLFTHIIHLLILSHWGNPNSMVRGRGSTGVLMAPSHLFGKFFSVLFAF